MSPSPESSVQTCSLSFIPNGIRNNPDASLVTRFIFYAPPPVAPLDFPALLANDLAPFITVDLISPPIICAP